MFVMLCFHLYCVRALDRKLLGRINFQLSKKKKKYRSNLFINVVASLFQTEWVDIFLQDIE